MRRYYSYTCFLLAGLSLLLVKCIAGSDYNRKNSPGSYTPSDGITQPDTSTPEAPTTNPSSGFIPEAGTLQYSETDSADDNNEDENTPLYKSSSIRDRENRWGTSAPFTDIDYDVLEDYKLGVPINDSSDIKAMRVYADLKKERGRYYSGKITVSYKNKRTKKVHYTQFYSGRGENAKYNVWITKSNKKAFHGFFQENEGSLVLVVDHKTICLNNPDNPDQCNNLYGGSVWIMMFRTTFNGKHSCNNEEQMYISEYNKSPLRGNIPSLSERDYKCWFITSGPFDCRTWRQGRYIDAFRAIEPDDACYSKLGEFEGLDIAKAFEVKNFNELAVHPEQ